MTEEVQVVGGNTRPPKNNGGSSDNTPIRPVDCSSFYGKPEYYERRYADYIKRYKNEDKGIYYIEYGLYYCNKFLDLKGSGKMSVDGNKWIDKTLVLLQKNWSNKSNLILNWKIILICWRRQHLKHILRLILKEEFYNCPLWIN